MQELFANEQFTGKQFLRVKIERRITILCEEHFHIGPQVHKMDRSISKLLEARVKAEGLDEVTLMHGWILRYLYEHQDAEIYQKDIEKYFGICRSGVTNIIQALEKKGLVCRASVESEKGYADRGRTRKSRKAWRDFQANGRRTGRRNYRRRITGIFESDS